jgi:hypothetical protein
MHHDTQNQTCNDGMRGNRGGAVAVRLRDGRLLDLGTAWKVKGTTMKKITAIAMTLALVVGLSVATMVVLSGCGGTPSWEDATKASCWNGGNAEQRMMNIPSPTMSDGTVKGYVAWMRGRNVNTAHVIICNKADGEHAGYCVYGSDIDWTVDDKAVAVMNKRIGLLRREGWAVVVWLMTDDSTAWNKKLLAKPEQYLADVKKAGLLDEASIVCLGLEMSEYMTVPEAVRLEAATRKVYKGKIATHDVSGSLRFAGLGDIVFAQVSPETSDAAMMAFAAKVKATGKPCGIIEHRRNPDRARCEKLIAAGLPFVGNW